MDTATTTQRRGDDYIMATNTTVGCDEDREENRKAAVHWTTKTTLATSTMKPTMTRLLEKLADAREAGNWARVGRLLVRVVGSNSPRRTPPHSPPRPTTPSPDHPRPPPDQPTPCRRSVQRSSTAAPTPPHTPVFYSQSSHALGGEATRPASVRCSSDCRQRWRWRRRWRRRNL